MECLHPIRIAPWKNHRRIEEERLAQSLPITFLVGCGKCFGCLSNRRQEYVARAKIELENTVDPSFVITLTYSDENLPISKTGVPTLCTPDYQKFLKRLRKRFRPFRYFGCAEYGSTGLRPHYHIILFGLAPINNDFKGYEKEFFYKHIYDLWPKGMVKIDDVDGRVISYCAKYVLMKGMSPPGTPKEDFEPPHVIVSRRPGLGSQWLENADIVNWYKEDLDRNGIFVDGSWSRMPRYYSSKIYNHEERDERHYRLKEREEEEFYKLGSDLNFRKQVLSHRNYLKTIYKTRLDYVTKTKL